MKFSSFSLMLFLAASLACASTGAPRRQAPLLRFEKVPLGNVARIFSARFSTTVTIAANATAPITGDFSSMDLKQALAEAAKQAGLVVVPAGPGSSGGFCLVESAGNPVAATAVESRKMPPSDVKSALAAAARRRAELLRKREDLLDQDAPQEY